MKTKRTQASEAIANGRKAATPAKGQDGRLRLSRLRRPDSMDPVAWQRALRQQFGREQPFTLVPLNTDGVFGDHAVGNPERQSTYRVAVRGLAPGDNFCTCPDYANNGLGTCKHVEFALHSLQGRRGGKKALARGWQPSFSEVWLRYGDQRTVHFRAGASCPTALQRLATKWFDHEKDWQLPDDRLLSLHEFVQKARRAADAHGHELKVYDDALAFSAQARDAAHRLDVLRQAYPRGIRDKGLAKLLATRLYPYQIEGALFAARAGRVLIGDDMGLGKTVQGIAVAELMARHFGVRRVLVVCPTSLKHQWQMEIKRFAGRDAQVLGGLRPARQGQWREDVFCKIVNYETLVRDADLAQDWAPELMIVDEAQRVKNWDTQAARAIKRIAAPEVCPHVIVLTGTPLENRLEELVSLVQIVDQHRLGPTWRLMHAHQETDEAGRVTGYRDLHRLGETLAPILLRRRKAEVLTQLPERVDKTLFVPLTPQQRAHHDENGATVSRIVNRWRHTGYLSDTDQRRLQCALQNMRMACNSTWLLDKETDHGTKADELMTVLEELFEDPQAKAVVFSQWLGTHEVLMRRLVARGWGHVFFNGSVKADQRGELVKRFHDDPDCRLFLSTDAGSTGLNLQHAAAVIVNMDQPWNPAILEQRIGRVHRMGQRRGVQVINLVAEASIEQGMLSLLAFKKSLFAGVLDGGDSSVFMEGGRLTRFMNSVDSLTEGMVAEGAMPIETGEQGGGPDHRGSSSLAVQQDEPQEAHGAALPAPPSPGGMPQPDPWGALIHVGLQCLQALASTASPTPGSAATALAGLVHTDASSGERHLRLPLPEPARIQALADALQGLLNGVGMPSATPAPSAADGASTPPRRV